MPLGYCISLVRPCALLTIHSKQNPSKFVWRSSVTVKSNQSLFLQSRHSMRTKTAAFGHDKGSTDIARPLSTDFADLQALYCGIQVRERRIANPTCGSGVKRARAAQSITSTDRSLLNWPRQRPSRVLPIMCWDIPGNIAQRRDLFLSSDGSLSNIASRARRDIRHVFLGGNH